MRWRQLFVCVCVCVPPTFWAPIVFASPFEIIKFIVLGICVSRCFFCLAQAISNAHRRNSHVNRWHGAIFGDANWDSVSSIFVFQDINRNGQGGFAYQKTKRATQYLVTDIQWEDILLGLACRNVRSVEFWVFRICISHHEYLSSFCLMPVGADFFHNDRAA